jgi:lantibiotic modifying enzyme
MKESPIFVKTFDLLKWILKRTEKFPKSQRFFLAKRINDALLDFYECLVRAAVRKDQDKTSLREADVLLTRLRHYVRLAMEMGYLSFSQYEYASREVTEVGKLLGGWMRKSS